MYTLRETTKEDLKKIMSPRPLSTHKGQAGRLLLVCGSKGMAGAAVLCEKGALRSGAGLVTTAIAEELFPILQTAVPEAMCVDRETFFSRVKAREGTGGEPDELNRYDAIAIGCGMGADRDTYDVLRIILEAFEGPVIVDADGINALCRHGSMTDLKNIIAGRRAPVMMTPHPGEAGRLMGALGLPKGYKTREETVKALADAACSAMLLKGHETLIAGPRSKGEVEEEDRPVYVNRTGNPGMATGGSGDVLTGVTAALAASSVAFAKEGRPSTEGDAVDILRVAAYIHGLAGDMAAKDKGETGMTAMDIVDFLPIAFKEILGR